MYCIPYAHLYGVTPTHPHILYTYVNTLMRTYTHSCMLKHVYACLCTLTHLQTYTHTPAHIVKYIYMYMYTRMHTCVHILNIHEQTYYIHARIDAQIATHAAGTKNYSSCITYSVSIL